jgi:hypothetical protein
MYSLSFSCIPGPLLTAIFGALLCAAAIHGQDATLQQTQRKARDLQSRIVGRTCDPNPWPDCIRAEIAALRSVVRDYTLTQLNQTDGDVPSLLKSLRQIDDIYAIEVAGSPSSWDGRPPFVYTRDTPCTRLVVTVNHFASGGLALPPGVVIIQGFRKEGAAYVFAGETDDSLSGIMNYSHAEEVHAPVQTEMWLLLVGQVAGYMGHLDRARSYAFDGFRFRDLWHPEDREQMSVTVQDGVLTAEYLGPKTERPTGFPEQDVMEETLVLTPAGINRANLLNHGANAVFPRKPLKSRQ